MKQYFNLFMHFLLLISFIPSQMMSAWSLAEGGSRFYPYEKIGSHITYEDWERFGFTSDYDQILDLIDKFESGTINDEENYDPETLLKAIFIIAHFARKGTLSNNPSDAEALEEEIREFTYEEFKEYSSYGYDYFNSSSSFYGNGINIILCRSWLKKKCHQVGKFVRHHKKEILIGAAIIAAVATVAVVATTIACTAASAAVGAAAIDHDEKPKAKNQPIPITPALSEVVQEQTICFKELVVEENLLSETPNLSLGEKTRELGAYLAHEILDSTAELALIVPETVKVVCHKKIDQIFSTNLGVRWSKELKANSLMDNFDVGIIPVPGLLKGQKEIVELAATEVNHVRGWKVGAPIQNLTAAGTIPTWTTVRRRFWKNKAYYKSEEYVASDLERMEKGLAPQRYNSRTDQLESQELHHIPPQREGNLFNVVELWPDEHAAADAFRKIGK